jgi:opacity protein-like surface antigen
MHLPPAPSARPWRRPGALAGLAAGLALAVPGAASAGDANDTWQFEVAPYVWMAGLKGDVQSGNLPKTAMDVGFSDILDVLDFSFMGAIEARKGRWGFLFDAQYMKLSDSATASRTGPGPIGATLTAEAEFEMRQTIYSAAALYRLSEGATRIDAIGGVRYMKLDVDADVGATLLGPLGGGSRFRSRSGSESWADPYVGIRIQHPLSDRLTVMGYLDAGGFGVGSKSTWQALAGISYEFSPSISGKLGYRYLAVDYDDNGFLFDAKMQGAYMGLGFHF